MQQKRNYKFLRARLNRLVIVIERFNCQSVDQGKAFENRSSLRRMFDDGRPSGFCFSRQNHDVTVTQLFQAAQIENPLIVTI